MSSELRRGNAPNNYFDRILFVSVPEKPFAKVAILVYKVHVSVKYEVNKSKCP